MATLDTLLIVDRDLNKINQIGQYQRYNYVKNAFGYNTFSLEIPVNTPDGEKIIPLLDQEFYLINLNDKEQVSYVTVKSKKLTKKDKTLVLEGFGMKRRLFKNRTILEGTTTNDFVINRIFEDVPSDEIALTLIDENCINSSDPTRNFPNIEIKALSSVLVNISRDYNNEVLFEELKKMFVDANFTIKIMPNLATKKWEISVLIGNDLTGESISKVVFGEGAKNIEQNDLTIDDSSFSNRIITLSEDDNQGRVTQVGNLAAVGFDLYELPLFSNEFDEAKIIDDANSKLSETKSFVTFNARTSQAISNYTYGVDYNIMDKVIIKDGDTGLRAEQIITAATFIYEQNKTVDIVLEFGFTKTTETEQNRTMSVRLDKLERKVAGGSMDFNSLKKRNFDKDGKLVMVCDDFDMLAGGIKVFSFENLRDKPLYLDFLSKFEVQVVDVIEGSGITDIAFVYNYDEPLTKVPIPTIERFRVSKDGVVTEILISELKIDEITNFDILAPRQTVELAGGLTSYNATNQSVQTDSSSRQILFSAPYPIGPGETLILFLDNHIKSGLGNTVEVDFTIEAYYRVEG